MLYYHPSRLERTCVHLYRSIAILSVYSQAASRIASAYILYSLYTPYPIDINPFQSALLDQYQIYRLQSTSQSVPPATQNLQLLWVIWKILDDRGADVSISSASDSSVLTSYAA